MDGGSIAVPLFIVFLVLKLAKVTAISAWSWWWITSPLWIDAGASLVLGLLFLVLGAGSIFRWLSRGD